MKHRPSINEVNAEIKILDKKINNLKKMGTRDNIEEIRRLARIRRDLVKIYWP